MNELIKSWVASANAPDTQFPLNNLPYGVFSSGETGPRCGVAIGDLILDVAAQERAGVLSFERTLEMASWNAFMARGQNAWAKLRGDLISLLKDGSAQQSALQSHLVPMTHARLHMPLVVTEFTDFYAGRHHATNVGTMFRGAENALPPNWLHIPIGYNGRASSVVVSGTEITRPNGQLKGPNDTAPRFAPSARFDIELEMGAIVGQPSNGPITKAKA